MEADLAAAQARVEAAEARYKLACHQVADDLGKPLQAGRRGPAVSGEGPALAEVEAGVPSEDYDPGVASKGSKNASAKTDKQNSSDKWLSKRAAESRVHDRSRKLRDQLRHSQRSKRMQFAEGDEATDEAPAPAPDAGKPASPKKERSPLFASAEVEQGAKGLADRLLALKDRPDEFEKKVAVLKVLTGGRDNYFTSEPADVLADLAKKGLVPAGFVADLKGLLQSTLEKGGPIPKEEWLAHAKKVSETKDDEPFKDSEVQYLKWIEKMGVLSAEAELDAAQQQLEQLLHYVDTALPADDAPGRKKGASAEQQINEDYAAQLADKYDPELKSKGSKNASALSDKVVSKEKWEKDRKVDNKEFEKNVKAREARREEARDMKASAANHDD